MELGGRKDENEEEEVEYRPERTQSCRNNFNIEPFLVAMRRTHNAMPPAISSETI